MRISSVSKLSRSVLEVLATIMVLVAACVVTLAIVTYKPAPTAEAADRPPTARPKSPTLPTEPIRIDSSARLGEPTAPVVVIEYSDFRCLYQVRTGGAA